MIQFQTFVTSIDENVLMLVMRIHRIVVFYSSGPDKNEDDDLIFEDFARLRLKGGEHLDSADA